MFNSHLIGILEGTKVYALLLCQALTFEFIFGCSHPSECRDEATVDFLTFFILSEQSTV